MPKGKKKDVGPKTIRRRVFFYRVNAGIHPDTGEPKKVNFANALSQLGAMPFSEADDGRYLATNDDKQLCCWVDNLASPVRLRLVAIRRNQHPPIENAGAFTALVLPAGCGLADITHLVLFPDGICGAEFNFYGPRASALSYYSAIKLKSWCPPFRLNPLVRPDLAAKLAAMQDIKVLNLKVRASYASVLEQTNSDLGSAFRATINAVSAREQDELELVFVRKRGKKLTPRSVPSALMEGIRKLAKRPDLREQASIFKITGADSAGSRPLDILSEQFTAEQTVMPAQGSMGGVDSESMFSAIEAAYSDVQAQLAAASELE
ncbi:MAG TPA: hypothetical protein VHZ09_11915 [Acidobacteriaceae bacterium]|jgi:hypothetical protein|nr:hypothetical protein [Acidobacteriaceae bacterium]